MPTIKAVCQQSGPTWSPSLLLQEFEFETEGTLIIHSLEHLNSHVQSWPTRWVSGSKAGWKRMSFQRLTRGYSKFPTSIDRLSSSQENLLSSVKEELPLPTGHSHSTAFVERALSLKQDGGNV